VVCAVLHGLGWLFLLLASVVVLAPGRKRPAGARALRWRARWQRWFTARPSTGPASGSGSGSGAYYWLASRVRLRPALIWAVLGLIACGWFWGLAREGRDWLKKAPTS